MAAILRLWALVVALTVSLAATEARANPDVWVETTIIVTFDDQRVSGLEFSWIFDDFYSARTVQTYDLDRDGTLNPLEAKNLRAETFDPLSHGRLFRSRLVGGGETQGLRRGPVFCANRRNEAHLRVFRGAYPAARSKGSARNRQPVRSGQRCGFQLLRFGLSCWLAARCHRDARSASRAARGRNPVIPNPLRLPVRDRR